MIWRPQIRGVVLFSISVVAASGAQSLTASDADDGPLVPWLPEPAILVNPVAPPAPVEPAISSNRIMGVIPDFQTVRDPKAPVVPLTPKQKWTLAFKETVDPFNIASAAMTAGFSQMGNETPKYGEGGAAYGKRFGAAIADFGTQNFFSAGVLATLLHQDPRYFRKGPGSSILRRVAYSVSRVVITRQDSGAAAFNASGIFGTMLGIAASNLYYPTESIRGDVMLNRLTTSFTGSVTGNLLSEFWPDLEGLQKKLFHHKTAP